LVAYISLASGDEAIVDVSDLPVVSGWSWHVKVSGGIKYAVRDTSPAERLAGAPNRLSLHRLILDVPVGMVSDHVNGNGLDNRRANLRVATSGENARNRSPNRGRSLPKGVTAYGADVGRSSDEADELDETTREPFDDGWGGRGKRRR
jgi:hypothetical protein